MLKINVTLTTLVDNNIIKTISITVLIKQTTFIKIET